MFGWIARVVVAVIRWLRPWESQTDERLREEMYRRFIDSLG